MFLAAYHFLAVIFVVSLVRGTSVKKVGPYDIDLRYIEPCYQDPDALQVQWKLQRVNRSMVIANITVELKVPIDNRIKTKTNYAVMTNQGWKDNYYETDFNNLGFCELAKLFLTPEQIDDIFVQLRQPVKKCPIPPGSYSGTFVYVMKPFKLAPVFAYNKYRARMHFYDEYEIERFCLLGYFDLVPKRVRSRNRENTNQTQLDR